ncbi:MAG: haloacid dehalogenase-like hydrolase [Pseudomonadota bacterium]|nr:haloacid dehalogenase-like hydrolase [Pseudomonadota bacterium]
MHETIAVVFDFDDTLAPDTTTGYLRHAGLADVARFWKEEVAPLTHLDWDPVPAYLYQMIEAARAGQIPPITRQSLAEWGTQAPLYKGVKTIFGRLRREAHAINPRVKIEFYVISSGIGDVLRSTSIAGEFHDIWASEFHYKNGVAVFPKKIVSFTDKTRYLFQVQKGLIGTSARGKPFDVNRKLTADEIHVPLKQMIFVGDGYTDIPCFSLLKQHGGIPIAVYDPNHKEKWGNAFQFTQDGRVSNTSSANYAAKSDLSNYLTMAVRKLANDITLAKGTYQG